MKFLKWRCNNQKEKGLKPDCKIAWPVDDAIPKRSGNSVHCRMGAALLCACLALLSCNQAQKLLTGSFSMRLVHPQNLQIQYEIYAQDEVDLSGFSIIPTHPAAIQNDTPEQYWVSKDELISAADLASVKLIKPRKKKLWTREEYEAFADRFDPNGNVKPKSYEDYLERNRTYWEIGLTFSSSGKTKFAAVTAQNINRQLAIIVDGQVVIAPKILEPIHNGEAMLTGSFSKEEAKEIIRKIVGD